MAKNSMQRSLFKIIYGYPADKEKMDVWQYFDNCCAYCGYHIEVGSRKGHLDHLIAISDGGTNDIHNFVLACHICNGDEKREQSWLDFLKLKCSDLSSEVFEQRLMKIKTWQGQSDIQQFDENVQLEIKAIIEQAKQDFDKAVDNMRALKQKINS